MIRTIKRLLGVKVRAKSRLRKWGRTRKTQQEVLRRIREAEKPRRANGQYKRKIPCYYMGKVIKYIYL